MSPPVVAKGIPNLSFPCIATITHSQSDWLIYVRWLIIIWRRDKRTVKVSNFPNHLAKFCLWRLFHFRRVVIRIFAALFCWLTWCGVWMLAKVIVKIKFIVGQTHSRQTGKTFINNQEWNIKIYGENLIGFRRERKERSENNIQQLTKITQTILIGHKITKSFKYIFFFFYFSLVLLSVATASKS